jgi:hypothetical protein
LLGRYPENTIEEIWTGAPANTLREHMRHNDLTHGCNHCQFYFDKGNPALFHSGSTCGFSTYSINIPGQKTSIVYFSNIAGNAEPFKKILEILNKAGIGSPAQVFSLHQLTR